MNLRRVTNEQIIFFAIFLFGVAIRFYQLGSAPLSDSEASWALQALRVSRPELTETGIAYGSQPAYIMLTGMVFSLFGASNFWARFWPAVAGTLLVLSPYMLSRANRTNQLGSLVAMILALGLAVAPGLVVASRTAGSPIMAVAFTLLAIASIALRQPLLAGIASGLALLSGPQVVSGGLSIAAALGLFMLWQRVRKPKDQQPGFDEQAVDAGGISTETFAKTTKLDWRTFIVSCVLTILLVSTFFFLRPQGLAAWLQTLPDYLRGWAALPVIPASRLLAAIVLYQPIAVLFGLLAILRAFIRPGPSRNGKLVWLSIFWLITTLFFTLVYPARQVIDAIWILIPLIGLASWDLSHYIPRKSVHIISLVNAALIVVLLGLLWYTLASFNRLPPTGMAEFSRLIVIVGIIGLGVLATVMVSMGWSWDAARLGLVGGLVVGLGLFSISALSSAAHLRQNQPQELWGATPAPGKVDLVINTLEKISLWQTGTKDNLDILSQVDAPSMRWLLRDFINANFTGQTNSSDMPSIVITSQFDETPALSAAYRGQDFIWWVYPGWNGALPQDFIPWLTFRAAPLQSEKIILWVRSDIFPSGILAPLTESEDMPVPQEELLEDPKVEQRNEDIR